VTVGELAKLLKGLDDDYEVVLVDAHGATAEIIAVEFDSNYDGVKVETDSAFIEPGAVDKNE
jgi:hypothetical protein